MVLVQVVLYLGLLCVDGCCVVLLFFVFFRIFLCWCLFVFGVVSCVGVCCFVLCFVVV